MNQITEIDRATSVGVSAPSRPRHSHHSFFSNVVTVFAGQIVCALIALAIEILCARLLGPVGRGQMALGAMAVAFGTLLGGLGGEVPIISWAANKQPEPALWLPSIAMLGFLGSLAAAAAWIVLYFQGQVKFLQGVTPSLAWTVAAVIPASILFNYLVAVLTGLERFRMRATVSFATQITELITIATLMWVIGRTATAAMLGVLFGFLVGTGVTAYALPELANVQWFTNHATNKFWPALTFGLRGQLGNLATFFTYRLDVFIVNFFVGPADVGIYAVGVVVSEALWQIPQAAAVVLFPRSARSQGADAVALTCSLSRHILIIAILTAAAIAIAAPVIVPRLFGSDFQRAIAVIWWILPGTVALSLGKLMSAELAGRGIPEFSSAFAIVALAVTVILDLFLIPKFNIQGAAIASSAAYFVDSVLLVAKAREVLGVSWGKLLAPTREEFSAYLNAWSRCRAWLGSQSIA